MIHFDTPGDNFGSVEDPRPSYPNPIITSLRGGGLVKCDEGEEGVYKPRMASFVNAQLMADGF